jgi:hypothetical protein
LIAQQLVNLSEAGLIAKQAVILSEADLAATAP